MAFPPRREMLPSVAKRASERVQAPQQGCAIADAHAGRTHRRKDRPIINLKCGLVLAELNMKQGFVPPDVHAIEIVLRRPEGFAYFHPSEPVLRAAHHLHNMRDAMVRPIAEWLQFGGCTCGVLGPRVVTGFFQSEAVKRLHDPVALLSLGPQG